MRFLLNFGGILKRLINILSRISRNLFKSVVLKGFVPEAFISSSLGPTAIALNMIWGTLTLPGFLPNSFITSKE